jgi:hypothetical protein
LLLSAADITRSARASQVWFLGGLTRRIPGRLRRVARWTATGLAALLALTLILTVGTGWLLMRASNGHAAAWARSRGNDAVWLGRIWAQGDYTPAQFRALVHRVGDSGISDVYLFTGQLDENGHLNPAAYDHAGPFLAAFRAALPHVQVSAWLSGVVAADGESRRIQKSVPGPISLDEPASRARVVASAAAVLRAGFGGVHYDLEPVTNGDPDFLRLLAATDRLRPAPRPLSVSVPKIEPVPGLRLSWELTGIGPVYWTPAYLSKVASLVGQVAVMTYDTTMPVASMYAGFVARETELALRAVPPRVRLLMGAPCYHYTTFAHRASAETVAAAVRGVRVGLTASGRRANFGVAMFADYSSTAADWRSYRTDWLRP